jgi:hypothetical protein
VIAVSARIPLDHSEKLLDVEWLRQVVVTPGRKDFLPITGHGKRGHGDDRDGSRLLVSFELARRLYP